MRPTRPRGLTPRSVSADPTGTATAAVAAHVGLADPHAQYALESALGGAALLDVGTTPGTVAAGDDARIVGGFTGLLARDHDQGSTLYVKNTTVTLKEYDVGAHGHLVLHGLRLPPVVNAALRTRLLITFQDTTTVFIENANAVLPLNDTAQGLGNFLMGDAANDQAATNDGKAVRKIAFQVRNSDAVNDITADLAAFRVRAYAHPLGGGAVVTTP